MPSLPEIVPVTDLRQDSASVLKRVRSSRRPLVVTQRGRATAVLLSVEAYEQGERERELLLLLLQGDRAIGQGEGHDLDEVLAEADVWLAAAAAAEGPGRLCRPPGPGHL